MKGVELYGQVRRAVYVEGLSRREAARRFGIDPLPGGRELWVNSPDLDAFSLFPPTSRHYPQNRTFQMILDAS